MKNEYLQKIFLLCPQARLRLAEVVEKEDVDEAMRLMEMSKASLNDQEPATRYSLKYYSLNVIHLNTELVVSVFG